jgi:hypothetical protein
VLSDVKESNSDCLADLMCIEGAFLEYVCSLPSSSISTCSSHAGCFFIFSLFIVGEGVEEG